MTVVVLVLDCCWQQRGCGLACNFGFLLLCQSACLTCSCPVQYAANFWCFVIAAAAQHSHARLQQLLRSSVQASALAFERSAAADVVACCLCRLIKLSPEAEAALAAADVRIIYAMAHAPEKSLGILVMAENGVWQTSVGGFGDKTPPLKDDQIFEWAKKVRLLNLTEVIVTTLLKLL
jgi:hypothetical protein